MSGINVSSLDHCRFMWQRFKAGDQNAFSFFYKLYVNDVYHYATKLTDDRDMIKDSIQEVFVDLYERGDKIPVPFDHLKFYLLLALKRSLIRRIKRTRRHVRLEAANLSVFLADYGVEDELIESEKELERSRKIAAALDQLPAKRKEALYLRYNERLEYEEIADIMGISVDSERKQVYRAIKTLKKMVDSKLLILLSSLFLKKT